MVRITKLRYLKHAVISATSELHPPFIHTTHKAQLDVLRTNLGLHSLVTASSGYITRDWRRITIAPAKKRSLLKPSSG